MTPNNGLPPASVLTPASLDGDEDDVVLRRNLRTETEVSFIKYPATGDIGLKH